jgi:phosphoglycolate phosphatase
VNTDGLGQRRLAIFDFDGTLADTWRDIANALNRTLRETGLPLAEGPEVRFWIGDGVLKLLERAVPEPHRSPQRIAELHEQFREHYEACCMDTTEMYPGMIECLDELSTAALAIASNKPSQFLDRMVGELGLKPYFRLALGGDSLPVRKPDGRVVEEVIARLGEPVDEVFMVGDSGVDVETGRAAGAHTIGCLWGLRGREELDRAGADVLVGHPREIPPVVLGRVVPR